MFLMRISLTSFISLLLAVVSARVIGHQQHDNPLLLDVYRCEDRICALGITPGLTTFDDALAILRSNPHLEISPSMPAQARRPSMPFYEVMLSANPTDGSITQISLIFPPTPTLTASHLIAKFGSPCFFIQRPSLNQTALIYPNLTLFFRYFSPNLGRFLPATLMTRVTVQAANVRDCPQMEVERGWLPWRGFRVY